MSTTVYFIIGLVIGIIGGMVIAKSKKGGDDIVGDFVVDTSPGSNDIYRFEFDKPLAEIENMETVTFVVRNL